jgi:hypothetical protein
VVGYFLVLTVVLPSFVSFRPEWVKDGVYAEYSVEDRGGGGTVMNGTYVWRVVSVQGDVFGTETVIVNETFEGSTHWSRIQNVPSGGRLVEVNIKEGAAEGLLLWIRRYYNRILLGRSFFVGGGYAYAGIDEREMSFGDEARNVIAVLHNVEACRRAYYDIATGVLLHYTRTWPKLGTAYVKLRSTNIFNSTELDSEPDTWKTVTDGLLITPLFVVPVVGASAGLWIIKRRELGFNRIFWHAIALFNGLIFAWLANLPFKAWYPPSCSPYPEIEGLLATALFSINIFIWFIVTESIVLIIDRFSFPIITKK